LAGMDRKLQILARVLVGKDYEYWLARTMSIGWQGLWVLVGKDYEYVCLSRILQSGGWTIDLYLQLHHQYSFQRTYKKASVYSHVPILIIA